MSHSVTVVCRPQVAIGFMLVGLRPIEVDDAQAAAARLLELASDRDSGVILIEEPLHNGLPPETRRALDRRALPMLVPFPGPAWAAPATAAREYVVELLRQAIGYRVRLT